MTRIEILYIDDCPNHQPAVQLVREVIRGLDVEAETAEIKVSNADEAQARQFLGSPSIRVDGVDIEPAARDRQDFGLSCRRYGREGLPPRELVEAALLQDESAASCCAAGEHRRSRLGAWAPAGSVLAAIVSSACCWLPLGLIAFGFSVGGIGAFFEKTRFIFLPIAAVLLALGFYYVYFRSKSERIRAPKFTRAALWIAAASTAAFAFLPSYIGVLADGSDSDNPPLEAAATTVTLSVDGMTCEGCAVTARQALMAVPGVQDAHVLFDEKRATIALDDTTPTDAAVLMSALERAGYEGRVLQPERSSASTTRGVQQL